MKRILAMAVLGATIFISPARPADGNPDRGERVFRACAPCHALEPGRSLTGPSLSGMWNRKAASVPSFPRYSPALKSANVVWDDRTLDEWIEDPQRVVPDNQMTFPGIKDAQQRADLLAFLKRETQAGNAASSQSAQRGGQVPDLKKLDPEERVQAIRYCGDTYKVTTADGKTRDFWERNLRFKTDSSGEGPEKGAPAIERAGMMGDRASVIFASPEEISRFILHAC